VRPSSVLEGVLRIDGHRTIHFRRSSPPGYSSDRQGIRDECPLATAASATASHLGQRLTVTAGPSMVWTAGL
ncbi:hypothetical protein Droror1_Dr00000114, partial [Drosera rotundifolia]